MSDFEFPDPDDPRVASDEIFAVDWDGGAVIVCGCHGAAFVSYSDFHTHTNGTYPSIVEAENDAVVFTDESAYRSWALEEDRDSVVVAEVREASNGGYSIPVPAKTSDQKSMRTSYVLGYEAYVDGVPRSGNPYDPDDPEYDKWSGFVRSRELLWYDGWDAAEARLGGKAWVDSHRERLEGDE